jgi:hypothetical protein
VLVAVKEYSFHLYCQPGVCAFPWSTTFLDLIILNNTCHFCPSAYQSLN